MIHTFQLCAPRALVNTHLHRRRIARSVNHVVSLRPVDLPSDLYEHHVDAVFLRRLRTAPPQRHRHPDNLREVVERMSVVGAAIAPHQSISLAQDVHLKGHPSSIAQRRQRAFIRAAPAAIPTRKMTDSQVRLMFMRR